MTAKLESDSFFDSDGENFSQDKSLSKLNPESKDTNLNRSSSSTSGHFSNNTGDDKMSAREQSARSYTVYSRQSRSPSNSYQYSDSFDSENSGQDTRQATPASRRRKKTASSRAPQKSTKSYSSASTNVGRSTTKRKPGVRKGTGTKSVGNSSSRTMSLASVQQSPRTNNEIAQRMLSAKGHTINRLRNELEELKLKYDDTLSENRLLTQVQRRQERALTKFQDDEADLPQLLKKHSAELDSLNRRIRKYQQKDKDKERRSKEQHEQLLKTRDELKRLQDLAADKGLKERDQLRRRADQVDEELEEKNRKMMDLEKYTENMKKNHRRAEHQWRVKELDVKNRLRDAEIERDRLRLRLREKEKELDVQNIYSHRISKNPSRLQAINDSNQRHLSISKSVSVEDLHNSVSPRSDVKPSPRHKVNRTSSFRERDVRQNEKTEDVRTEPETVVQEEKSMPVPSKSESFEISHVEEERKSPEVIKEEQKPIESPKKQKTFDREEKKVDVEEKTVEAEKEDEHLKILRMLDADVQNLETKKPTAKPVSTSEKEDKTGKVFGNTNSDNGAYKPTWLFGNKGDSENKKDVEKKNDQQIKESPKKRIEKEEEEDFPFFGPSNPKQSPSQSTKQPTGVVNSVRDLHKYSNSGKSDKNEKKDNVVFNSSWKDDIGENKRNASTTQNDDYQKKKELLLQKMKDIDNSESNERSSSGKSQKDYKFSEPVENLHHGRPSHPEVNLSPRSSRKNQSNFTKTNGRRTSKEDIDVDEITFGSYAPSFSKPKDVNQEKQAVKPTSGDLNSLDSNDRNVRSSFGGENIFSTSTKAKPVADSAGLPWETNSRPSQGRPTFNANNKQNTLFATTPYSQQKSPFAAKPITAGANDDIDDDIEEFIL